MKYYLIILSLLVSSCATLFGDNNRAIFIQSSPAGANIYVDNELKGITPTQIYLPAYIYGDHTVKLVKSDYTDTVISINPRFSWISLLNIFNLGFGFFVDFGSGDILQIPQSEKSIYIQMIPRSAAVTQVENKI